jgi:hypothetical protein
MKLNAIFRLVPKGERREWLVKLAAAHGKSSRSVYRWVQEDGLHPKDPISLSITEKFTNYEFSRFDEYPELYDRNDTAQALRGAENLI